MSLVIQDPRDVSGVRQKLNLGHTFAHALEKITNYKKYRHGEAVLLGLIFALIVSKNKKVMNPLIYKLLVQNLSLGGLPEMSPFDPKKLYQIALKDKKSEYGKLKMVLIVKPGVIRNPVAVSETEFVSACKEFMDFHKDIRHNKL
jgi:3-dehydroquinate synthetase